MELQVNGRKVRVEVEAEMPLLWLLRDELGLTGTKFGCGVAACGACTVHVDGRPVRACVTPAGSVAGREVRTIEGLSGSGLMARLQAAWLAEQAPQCGYCQSGMLMAAAALLEKTPRPAEAQVEEAISNICRCGTYQRVKAAVLRAARGGA